MGYVPVHTPQSGFSLVETIVAIAILLLALVGPLTIATKGIQAGEYSKEQTIALYLAQEGIEAFVAARNNAEVTQVETPGSTWNWNWIPSGTCTGSDGCGIDFANSDPLSRAVKCNPVTKCILSLDESASRAKFLLPGTGTPTEFTRVITITNGPDGGAAGSRYVTATVSWQGTLFNTAVQQVSLTRALYQIN